MIKTANIIPALIKKVNPPIKLYNSPPIISPTMLARLPKLLATPCTNPWYVLPEIFESIDMKDGHISPFPTANRIAAP
jgi:hypothetical protein